MEDSNFIEEVCSVPFTTGPGQYKYVCNYIHICTEVIYKDFNLKKEVGIALKSKETSSQLELVRNSYVTTMHQPITDSSNICSQMHVQIQHSLAYLQDLNPTLATVKYKQ